MGELNITTVTDGQTDALTEGQHSDSNSMHLTTRAKIKLLRQQGLCRTSITAIIAFAYISTKQNVIKIGKHFGL